MIGSGAEMKESEGGAADSGFLDADLHDESATAGEPLHVGEFLDADSLEALVAPAVHVGEFLGADSD